MKEIKYTVSAENLERDFTENPYLKPIHRRNILTDIARLRELGV